jgi:hypothetical protein
MNRRDLIKKGLGLSVAATGILGIISTRSRANSALDALEALVQQVIDLDLQNGISISLDAKLNAALQAIDDINENNNVAAINSMEAFINAVEAQRGNKIEDADANTLIAAADAVITALSACSCSCDCGVVGCDCEPPCVPPCGSGGI